MLDRGVVNTQAELAAQVGVTPARISQLLRILTLPAPVITYLRELHESQRRQFSERKLRPITKEPKQDVQLAMFNELRTMALPEMTGQGNR